MKLKKILSVFLAAMMTAISVTFVSSAEEIAEIMETSVSDSEEVIVKDHTYADPKVSIEYVEPADSENSYDMKITWNDVNPNGWYWVRLQARMGNSEGYLVKSNEISIPFYFLSAREYTVKIFLMNSKVVGCDGFFENMNGDEPLLWYSKNVYTPPYFLVCTEKLSAASTQNSVTLNWGKVKDCSAFDLNSLKQEDIVRYSIEQRVNGKWKQIGTTAKTTYQVKNLNSGVKYDFKVTPYGKEIEIDYGISEPLIYYQGYRSTSEEVSVTTKPGSTMSLKAVPGKSTAKLSWSKNASAKYYRVYSVKNGKFTQLTQTANNSVLSYTATGLNPSAIYTYRVIAFNSSNISIATSDISTKTLSNIGNLTVSPGKTTAKLTWAKNPNATNYKLSILKNGAYTTLKTTTGSTLTATGLVPSANYTLRISAFNASGIMIGYSDITTKTLSNIGNLTVSPGKTTAKLTWAKNPNATNYKLSILKNGAYTTLKTTTGSTLTATGLVPSANYTLRISAFNASGKMIGYSDISTRTLSNIGNLTVTPYKNSATLRWSKNPNATSYRVLIQKNGSYTNYAKTTGGVYTVAGLNANTTYTLRVSAYDASGKMIGYSDISAKTVAN